MIGGFLQCPLLAGLRPATLSPSKKKTTVVLLSTSFLTSGKVNGHRPRGERWRNRSFFREGVLTFGKVNCHGLGGGRGVGAKIDLFAGRRGVQILKCPKPASSLQLQPSRWSRHPRHRRRVAASVGIHFFDIFLVVVGVRLVTVPF